MCIKKVESYSFEGQLYATELDAIYAALNKVAMGIVKNHASKPVTGLLDDPSKLASLLMRYHDLFDAQRSEAPSRTRILGGFPLQPQRGSQEYALQASPHSSDGLGG